tara:strand:- start:627 stop:1616 length:990 start_codon:yes stop_codon:yes gene_type:complete
MSKLLLVVLSCVHATEAGYSKWHKYYDWVEHAYANTPLHDSPEWRSQQSLVHAGETTGDWRIVFLVPVSYRENVSYVENTVLHLLSEFGSLCTVHVFHNGPRTNLLRLPSIIEHEYDVKDRALFAAMHSQTSPASFSNRNHDWMTPTHQQHNLDVAYMLAHVPTGNDSDLFSVIEDDMVACKGASRLFLAILEHADSLGDWSAIRTSAGANGVFFSTRLAPILSGYIAAQRRFRIIDNLLLEFYNSESPEGAAYNGEKLHFVSRHNLFEHVGSTSSYGKARTQVLQHPSERVLCYGPVSSALAGWLRFDTTHCSQYPASPCAEAIDPFL